MSQTDYPSEKDQIERAANVATVELAEAAKQQVRAAAEAVKAAKDAAEASRDTAQKTLWIAVVMLLGLIIDLILRVIGI